MKVYIVSGFVATEVELISATPRLVKYRFGKTGFKYAKRSEIHLDEFSALLQVRGNLDAAIHTRDQILAGLLDKREVLEKRIKELING